VEALALDPGAYDGDFTPLDLLNTLLDREISHTERQGGAFSVSALPIHYGNVNPLRTRALEIITKCLESSKPRMAVDAVDSLSHVLSEYHPGLRVEVTTDEQQWQDGERLRALQILTTRVERGSLALPVVWRIRKLLFWVIERSQLTDQVKREAEQLREKLELPEDFDVFDSLCADQWEYNTLEDGFYSVSEQRNQKEQRAVEFLKAHGNVAPKKAMPEAFIFPNADGGFLHANNYRYRVLGPLAKDLGIERLNFQILRRTMATQAQSMGSVKDIQAHLRHSRPDTTAHEYMQALPESVQAMVGSVYEMLMKGGEGKTSFSNLPQNATNFSDEASVSQ